MQMREEDKNKLKTLLRKHVRNMKNSVKSVSQLNHVGNDDLIHIADFNKLIN